MKEKHIYIKIVMIILMFTAIISGCSIFSPPNLKKQEETAIEEQKAEIGEKSGTEYEKISTADIKDIEGMKSYIIPETIWDITGMTAEEQAESFRDDNVGKQNFADIEVRDEALVLTMTEEQKENYEEEIETRIFEDIEEAIDKEDIRIEISEDYKKVKMVLGENSSIEGFHVTLVEISSEIGVYQILNGCAPEEWGFRLITERDEQVLINSNVPHGTWKLTEDDFEGKNQ